MQAITGLVSPIYDSLGTSYMDDNIQKSKTALHISVSYCIRLFGPAIGYNIASYCLSLYIAPELTPIIDSNDQRWLGAWWIGNIIIFFILTFFTFLLSLFPRELPRAQLRRLMNAKEKLGLEIKDVKATDTSVKDITVEVPKEEKNEMVETFTRLLTNKIFILNTIASVFYYFGYVAYWIYTAKYIETQYRQSASVSR